MTNYPRDPGHYTSPRSYKARGVGGGRVLTGEQGSPKGGYRTEGAKDQAGGYVQREGERVLRQDEGMEKGVRLVLPSCP